jgi:hypothetical protein
VNVQVKIVGEALVALSVVELALFKLERDVGGRRRRWIAAGGANRVGDLETDIEAAAQHRLLAIEAHVLHTDVNVAADQHVACIEQHSIAGASVEAGRLGERARPSEERARALSVLTRSTAQQPVRPTPNENCGTGRSSTAESTKSVAVGASPRLRRR